MRHHAVNGLDFAAAPTIIVRVSSAPGGGVVQDRPSADATMRETELDNGSIDA